MGVLDYKILPVAAPDNDAPETATKHEKKSSVVADFFRSLTTGASHIYPAGADRQTLDKTAKKDRSQTIFGPGAEIPILYGPFETDFRIFAVAIDSNNQLVLGGIAGWGEIESLTAVIDNAATDNPPTVTTYTGTTTQGVDPTLAAAISGYADDLVVTVDGTDHGLAYAVIVFPAGSVSGWPQIKLRGEGKKLYDHRTGTTAYSDTPALILADFMASDLYGPGYTLDYDSVDAAADANEDLVLGEKRRLLGLALSERQNIDDWIATLRTYAGCMVIRNSTGWALVPNRPRAVDRSYTAAEHLGVSTVKRLDLNNKPTVVKVKYTDTSVEPWHERTAIAQLPGVDAGTVARRESVIQLPGIQRYSQAVREATERLNAATLTDMSCTVTMFEQALESTVGDVIELTDPGTGFSSQKFRLLDAHENKIGRPVFTLQQYDADVFSDVVESPAVVTPLNMPSPLDPPQITDLVLTEELFQLQSGMWRPRIKATWTGVSYAYWLYYRIDLYIDESFSDSYRVQGTQFISPEVVEGKTYRIEVRTISRLEAASDPVYDTISPAGKTAIPGDVPSLTVFEVGGEVRASWEAAVDIDIWKYEIRYGAVGVTWENATTIDKTDSLRLQTKDIAEGTWDILVKAIDSVDNESANEARKTVTVTIDADAFFVNSNSFASPTLTAMHESAINRTGAINYVSYDAADSFAALYPNAMNTYTNALASYNDDQASAWLSETWDVESIVSGNWRLTDDAAAISGSYTTTIEISEDGSSWDSYTGNTCKAKGRYARVRFAASAGSVMLVHIPEVTLRLDAVPIEENGAGTSSATAATTITLDNDYVAVQTVSVQPLGSTARQGVVDNIVVGSPTTFDVYVFDSSGAQIASDFRWGWKGV